MKTKIISVLLMASLLITFFTPRTACADDSIYVDGYRFDVVESNGNILKLVTTLDNGDKLYATQDLSDGSITLDQKEYDYHAFGMGFGGSETVEYNVDVNAMNSDVIDVNIENAETGATIDLHQDQDVVTAQDAVAAVAAAAAGVLDITVVAAVLEALVIAGIVIVAFAAISSVASWVVAATSNATSNATSSKKYYMATIKSGKVVIYKDKPLTYEDAVIYLRMSDLNDIYTKLSNDAKNACAAASPILKVTTAEIDSKNGWKLGYDYYYHYHPLKNNYGDRLSNHCWYGAVYGL